VSKNFDTLRKVQLASRSGPWLAAIQQDSAETPFVIRSKSCVDPLKLEARAKEGLSRRATSRYLIGFFLGVLLLSTGVILLRHYERRAADNRHALEIETTSTGNAPEIPSPGSAVGQSTSTFPGTISLDQPGFVLQVAAMKHEENADALAGILRQKNFPVFVYERGADSYYRVAIGVYGDADSAAKVKDELERQSFKADLRHWEPE
jgi:septal ring-binding cell division protein DamX